MNATLTTLRPAILDDTSQLAALSGQLGYPATPQAIADRLRQLLPDQCNMLYVAVLPDKKIVGWVHACKRTLLMVDHFVEIEGLVIDQDYRSQQIGKHLLDEVERWAHQNGCTSVYVRSNIIREGAHRFYETNGYKRIKTQYAFRKEL